MSNLNTKNKEIKNSTVFTPVELSKKIFDLINDNYNFSTIFDPCIGVNGGMTKYFYENNYYIIGSDIDKGGRKHCHRFFNQDIKNLNIPKDIRPDIVIMNPPFNGNGRGKNLLYPHLFLKTIFDRFGENIPVVMITGDNFLNNNTKYSKRLQYISNGDFKITSIMTLPLNIFDGIKFNSQVLFFNLDKLNPYYIFDITKISIETNTNNINFKNQFETKLVS